MMNSHDTNNSIGQGELEENKVVAEAAPIPEQEVIPTTESTEQASVETTAAPVTAELPQIEEPVKSAIVEETQAEEAKAIEEVQPEEKEVKEPVKPTKESILAELKTLAEDAENVTKHAIDTLKQSFYKIHNSQFEAAKKAFLEGGGEEVDFFPPVDELEQEFKQVLGGIKEKRNQLAAQLEKQKEENLLIKQRIIEQLRTLVESPEDTSKSYNEFKKLQQQWKEIKLVPQGKINELWKNYQLYVEKFYDILKLNNEFRDYDFKKNLEIKNRLCESAEKLAEVADPISAFYQLQKLHQEYRETGPVAKDLRDEVWNRFKEASAVVNKRHQDHFEGIKETEQLNLDQKTVICEIVEAIDYTELKTINDWEAKTKEVIALQAKWKTIGFAPMKINLKVFERFRGACDEFFKKKGEFFQTIKGSMSENLEKKKALCEQAEALKDSTDWKVASDKFIQIQKEWREIGLTPRKQSKAIWERFIAACDYFFDQKNKATSSQRSGEVENLKKKRSIIEQLEAIDETMDSAEADELVRELMNEWNTIGHVPFRDKDKIYKRYRAAVDKIFAMLNLNHSKRKLSNFKENISASKGQQSVYKEREKLVRQYENLKSELQTYENNIGFLTASSKKGNNLLTEISRKVDKLKGEIELVAQKIKVIDESMREEKEA
ncbi:DUF349 domain-containing protein [Bacteroides sp. 214]|uniref:DUF349 domain-containing protein n=1 Tax=Bacteroides sp. 214 TaxID=2302935 RepID=UPI0013D30649|nr:DUF349 domain-containing protein [Bacteroides sp. 214]NDW13637.1 DUF349 domain-containing protein [Bacteroides sp. 214]